MDEQMSEIVQFLEGVGADAAGRTITTVLALSVSELEGRHDFIQWLFPLAEASSAVPGSPVLTSKDIEIIRASGRAQANLAQGAERMGLFYDQTDRWMRSSDHNHLRITRIIKSLRLLSGDRPADRFRSRVLARVEATRAPVSATSLGYWVKA